MSLFDIDRDSLPYTEIISDFGTATTNTGYSWAEEIIPFSSLANFERDDSLSIASYLFFVPSIQCSCPVLIVLAFSYTLTFVISNAVEDTS